MSNEAIVEIEPAWVVWTNTDLTEGRGQQYPAYVCKLRSTAARLGRGRGVMGSNCDVEQRRMFKVEGTFYGPVKMEYPTKEDEKADRKLTAKEAAIEKAKELGLTDEEIAHIAG